MIKPGPYAIDASVFLNAFNPPEKGSQTSKELLAKLQDEAVPIIAPTLLLVECAAAIGRGQGNPDLASQFARTLQRLPHLILVSLDEILARQAVGIAARFRLRGSDAVYAAVAQRFACPLVTLDAEQRERVAQALKTYMPEEVLELSN